MFINIRRTGRAFSLRGPVSTNWETLSRVVVGSGPSGVSCAHALLERGVAVTMLDAGVEAEPEVQERLAQIKTGHSRELSPEMIRALSFGEKRGPNGIPIKLIYGSDYPYQEISRFFQTKLENCDVLGSFAKGGLSNIWGAALLPYVQSDLKKWPIQLTDLAPHYKSVLSRMDLAGVSDELEEMFPLYCTPKGSVNVSRQGSVLLKNLQKNKDALKKSGILFGQSRIAVTPPSPSTNSGCTHCGLCLTGCPHQAIYSSSSSLELLKRNPLFSYRPGFVLRRFEEVGTHVRLIGQDLRSGEDRLIQCERLYIGCGPLPTTAIVLESIGKPGDTVQLKDSQYFLVPFLLYKNVPQIKSERLHAMSQIFLELADVGDGENQKLKHFQVYGYSEYTVRAIRNHLRGVLAFGKPLLDAFLGRLLILQSFMHSDDSPEISCSLTPASQNGPSLMHLKTIPNPNTKTAVKAAVSTLFKNRGLLGGLALTPFTEITPPGRSFHSGGTFPMSLTPTRLESDIYGRPGGLKRVHLIDSSTFPSIPGTTITLSIMANAHRIGAKSF